MPPFAPYFGNIHHGQIQHFQQATSTSRNATFIYGAGKRMTARSRQSEKCRREAIWLAEKPYRRSYLMVSAPKFDPNQGGSGMGQIWVRTKNHLGAEKLWGGSFLSIFQKKQCYLYKGYRQASRICWQYPTKGQEKTPGMKLGVFVIVDRFYWRIHLRRAYKLRLSKDRDIVTSISESK